MRSRLRRVVPLLALAPAAAMPATVLVIQRPIDFEAAREQILSEYTPDERPSVDAESLPEPVGDAIVAEAFREQGMLEPIVWSMSDPTFRGYMESGLVPNLTGPANDGQIRDAAKRTDVDYRLEFWMTIWEGRLITDAALYRGSSGKAMWRYSESNEGRAEGARVMVGLLFDPDATLRSHARTLVQMIASGPLSELPRTGVFTTPDPAEGTLLGGGTQDPLATFEGPDEAIARAQELMASEDWQSATLVMREAVDIDPFDPERRVVLGELLLRQGREDLAAREFAAAGRLGGGSSEPWLAAADAWLQSGEIAEADEALKQALARGATGARALLLKADILMASGAHSKAILPYTESLALEPSPRAKFGRALAYVVLGQSEASQMDMSDIGAINEPMYKRAISQIDLALIPLQDALRELPRAARIGEYEGATTAKAESAATVAAGIAAFLESVAPPPRYAKSHEARVLALRLLSQAAQETLVFVQTGDDDLAAEAAISLGEAIRLLSAVRDVYRQERMASQNENGRILLLRGALCGLLHHGVSDRYNAAAG